MSEASISKITVIKKVCFLYLFFLLLLLFIHSFCLCTGRFGDGLSSSSQSVIHMWSALSSFSDDERSRFLRFITGRKRLPSPFIVFRSSSSSEGGGGAGSTLLNSTLPSASTCGGNLFLPEYTSAEVAKEKLRYDTITLYLVIVLHAPLFFYYKPFHKNYKVHN